MNMEKHDAMQQERRTRTVSNFADALKSISAKPLQLRPDFPEVARRWESWWRFKSTRPLMLLSAPKRADIYWGKAFDYIDQPDEWLRLRRLQVESTHYAGDSIPSVRVDIGPVSIAAFLGATLHLSESEQTSWQDPLIPDWAKCPPLTLDRSNRWLQMVLTLAQRTARDAAGRYLLCFPDLAGAIDALVNMRTPENMCMDLVDNRDAVKGAAMKIVGAWHEVFRMLHETALGEGAGVTQWLGCWSDIPHTVPTCDFNALIGPSDFIDVCLPSLREQARLAGRCVIHLDGPAAARHAETLAQEPSINAIQYTPGAGTPSALAKIDMLRMLQKAGKPLLLICPREEVDELADRLDPGGLALWPSDVNTPQMADDIARRICARFPA